MITKKRWPGRPSTPGRGWLRLADAGWHRPPLPTNWLLSSGRFPAEACAPADVVDMLALGAEPGLMAMPSGRFFGWVIGGDASGRPGC